MKVRQILTGQAARFLVNKNYGVSHSTGYKLFREIKERYYFFQGPEKIEDFNLERGTTFLRGALNDSIKIDRLQLLKSAILCEASIDLDQCDIFLDDVIQFGSEILGVPIEENVEFGRIYVSQLEVELDNTLQKYTDQFTEIGKNISSYIAVYGNKVEPYLPSAIAFSGDPAEIGGIKTESFKLEERVGFPRREKIYYSSAPLKTKDHIAVLEKLERLFSL